jgi:hypothetical protein
LYDDAAKFKSSWRLQWKLNGDVDEGRLVEIVVEKAPKWPRVEIAWKFPVTSHLLRQSPQNPIAVANDAAFLSFTLLLQISF